MRSRRDPSPRPPQHSELPVEDSISDPETGRLVRLNKLLADCGVASRRAADQLIAGGKVSVDGEPATELGLRVDPARQRVEIDGFVLRPENARKRYYVLNKPAGVVCTNEPRETRPRAVDLVTDPRKGRIYTVGRLDEASLGLILLTNDGEFANRMMHPRYGVKKTYLVKVRGEIDDEALTKVREGVHLSEGRTSGARILVEHRGREHSLLTMTIREGMNREIRRSFAKIGYKVLDLRRTRIGPLTDRGLKTGRWRELERSEVAALLAGEDGDEARRPGRGPKRKPGRRGGAHPGARDKRPVGHPGGHSGGHSGDHSGERAGGGIGRRDGARGSGGRRGGRTRQP
jgi:pseudouridine synthase